MAMIAMATKVAATHQMQVAVKTAKKQVGRIE